MTERITAVLTRIALIALVLATFGFARAQTADPIEAIREHYAQINRSATSYKKVKKNLSGFSTEGGELVAYFHGPSVMKMVATFFGEMGKATEEYFYWNGKLIFVLRTDRTYDKPLSGKVIKTAESRFYFNNDAMIRWLDEASKQVASDTKEFQDKQNQYLKTSKQFSAGAGSAKPMIEEGP